MAKRRRMKSKEQSSLQIVVGSYKDRSFFLGETGNLVLVEACSSVQAMLCLTSQTASTASFYE
jgi:hypothetical protein